MVINYGDKMSKKIMIFDTTLRDGEQSPGCSMSVREKVQVAQQLEKLGVDIIEAGFPAASKEDFDAVQEIAKVITNSTIAALARANQKDIDRAWEAIKEAKKPRIHTFMSTSTIHLEKQFGIDQEKAKQISVEAVTYAKSFCQDVEYSAMDATRSEKKFLYEVFEAVIDAGATTINVPDTVGYSTPKEFGELIKGIKENVPNIDKAKISCHCHNDFGLATANSLEAVYNGAEQVECTINGIGERAGNAAMEEVVMAIGTRKDFYDAETNINTKEIMNSSWLVQSITGMIVQRNKSIVGRNAFAHEAGIHQDGLIKHKSTYEIMDPVQVGLKESDLVLGRHSGRAAIKHRLVYLGMHMTDEEINELFPIFKELATQKKEVTNEELMEIVNKHKNGKK